jgi:hypothetical protein
LLRSKLGEYQQPAKILWGFGLKPEGAYSYPAIIHDYLYWTQERPRDEADRIFLYAMEDLNVEEGLRNKIYGVVSVAGEKAWNDNKKRKAAGEKRVLRKFPPEPTITWEAWKKTPGVFYD